MFDEFLGNIQTSTANAYKINGKFEIGLSEQSDVGLSNDLKPRLPFSLFNGTRARDSQGAVVDTNLVTSVDDFKVLHIDAGESDTKDEVEKFKVLTFSSNRADTENPVTEGSPIPGDIIKQIMILNAVVPVPLYTFNTAAVNTRELYIASIIFSVMAGGIEDGGEYVWVAAPNNMNDFENVMQNASVSTVGMGNAMKIVKTIVPAAKINYWQMNHHFGINHEEGRSFATIAGALNNALKANNIIIDEIAEQAQSEVSRALYAVVHHYSTRMMLKQLGWGPIQVAPILGLNYFMEFDKDLYTSIRTQSNNFPAGVRKFALIAAGIKMINRRKLLPFFPRFELLDEFYTRYRDIKATPALYHVGAHYLCNEKSMASQSDDLVSELLGLVAQYVESVAARSSLMRSPAMKEASMNKTYYSDEWAGIIDQFKSTAGLKTSEKLISLIKGSTSIKFDQDDVKAYVENDDVGAGEKLKEISKEIHDRFNLM